jgi:hypothetical protein
VPERAGVLFVRVPQERQRKNLEISPAQNLEAGAGFDSGMQSV